MSRQIDYWQRNYEVGSFGISYLDKELGGIAKSDLILIGARSGCVDGNTEFFSQYGWKRIDRYEEGDLVLQADQRTLKAELVKPTRFIKGVCDKWYVFKGKYGIDMKLSPEHNVLYETCSGNFIKDSAKNIYQRYFRNKRGFEGKIPMSFDFSGVGIDLTDGQIKVMLAVIADGSICRKQCRFHIKKERKKQELRKIFKEAEIGWREKESCKEGYTDFYIYPPVMTKKFNIGWYNCNKHQLELICDNVLKWDGNIDRFGRRSFFTTDIDNADFVQFAFSACGYKATLNVNDRRGRVRVINCKEYITNSVDYVVTISNRHSCSLVSGVRKDNISIENKKENKYCFTVPSGCLVLRRNGKIFVTGNSGKSTIANSIFQRNCEDGRKCALFSLENFNDDLYSHDVMIEYKRITKNFSITPRSWQMNKFKVDYDALEKAESIVEKRYEGKYIINRQLGYTIEKLKADMIKACKDGKELIILDHIDYVDKDNPRTDDLTFMTDLMKTIRALQDEYGAAVVALSHLRKPTYSSSSVIIPNENEFIGSSNKAKEATVVILIAPDDEGNVKSVDDNTKGTWFCIRKLRNGGITNKCAKLFYDKKTDKYLSFYEVYSVNYAGTKVEFLEKGGNVDG